MDILISTAARALAAGDALAALNLIALRDDPPALALRGIAMAQLGDLGRARMLLRRAARGFGPRAAAARARCVVAEAEIALVARDLGWPAQPLDAARTVLDSHGDTANAAHAGYLAIRHLILIGRLEEAESRIAAFDPSPLLAASRAGYELVLAGIAMRRLTIAPARAALARAAAAAARAGIAALTAEVETATGVLERPAAQLSAGGAVRALRLDDIEALLGSQTLVVDAGRRLVCRSGTVIGLSARPVLFALVRTLAQAWPGDARRATLLARAFGARHVDESHRARLRVEIGRLRKALSPVAGISATRDGFVLVPHRAGEVAVLTPLGDEAHGRVLALLADGEAWSSSALALALGTSQRTVQRALDTLAMEHRVQAVGRGRARRWMTPPVPGFPTTMLLPAALAGG